MVGAMNILVVFPATEHRREFRVRRAHSAHVEEGWEMLTDTANVVLPRGLVLSQENIKEFFRKGDPIEIYWGYNGELNPEFKGYLSNVGANLPLKLECEDEMYILKRTKCNISLRPGKLSTLLNAIIPGSYTVDAADIEIGAVKFSGITVAQALEKLKDSFGIYSYFKNGVLVSGKIYLDDATEVTLDWYKHIKRNTKLEYQKAEDIKVQVKATSLLKNGKKIEVVVGDEDGEVSKLVYSGIETKQEVEKLANADLNRLKLDGYKGDIRLRGLPVIHHGYIGNLVNDRLPEREGKYFIKKVVKDYVPSHIEQVATLDMQAA